MKFNILKTNPSCFCLQAAGGALFLLVRWVRPKPVDPKYEALPCRQDTLPCRPSASQLFSTHLILLPKC